MISQRNVSLALGCALALICLATVFVFADDDWHHFADSATYLRTAQSLASGEGYSYQGEPYALRPPALAWLLSFFVDMPFDPRDVLDLNLVIQVSAALMLLFLFLALRRLHDTPCALLVTLLVAINPTTTGGFNSIFSEFPHMALFFAGAWLLMPKRGPGRPPAWRCVLLGALLLGASLWFRLVGLAVLPCLVLCKGGSPPRRARALTCGFLVLLLVLPWLLHVRAVEGDAPRPTTQWIAFSHSTGLWHVDARNPDSPLLSAADWTARWRNNLSDACAVLDHAFLGGDQVWARVQQPSRRHARPNDTRPAAAILAAALACCMLYTLAVRRSLLDVYMLIYVVIVLSWLTFVQRMLLPVMPLAISSVVFTLERLVGRFAPLAKRNRWLATALSLVTIWPLLIGLTGLSASTTVDARQRQIRRVERRTAEWIQTHTQPDDTILHTRPTILGLLGDRTSYTWRHLPKVWPEDCPPTDWAFYGPEDAYPEVHSAIAQRGTLEATLKAKLQGQSSRVLIYRLADD